jgi:hypothetical protein
MYGAEIWTHWKIDHKYLESFKMWCWRRMGKINYTYRVRNEAVLRRVKRRNTLKTIKRRKVDRTGHIHVDTAF